MAMTKQLAAPCRHQALTDDRAVDGHDGSERHAMSLEPQLWPFRPEIERVMVMTMHDHSCAHCPGKLINLWVAVRMAAGSLVANQNIRLLHSECEVVVRVDCRKRVLLLRRHDVFVLRSERQALEKVPVILDADIRAAW